MATVQRPPESPFSLRLFKAFGIPIRANITFIFFVAYVAWYSRPDALNGVIVALMLFACVLLHELGHALVARRYGIQTRDITLYFMGGIAMLESKPRPNAEFWIALAGPAVNLAIVLCLLPFELGAQSRVEGFLNGAGRLTLIDVMFGANLVLALFNLLPAFPMDGGRVLRALLGMWLPEVQATGIAASIGQILALLMFLVGMMYGQFALMLIALVVLFGAGQEVSASRTRSVIAGHQVADAMQSSFKTIESGASMETAAQLLVEGSQHDFPVVAGEEVIGVLTRNGIARGLASEGPSGYVAGVMKRDFKRVTADTLLEDAVEMFGDREEGPLLVMAGDELRGMLTREGVSEFIMLQDARSRNRPPGRR
ncbi:MAG TPA: site-2 protease family protein [Fimbriimonadaceae bacterium]|nr:site-2 protease family protein [Fimbriimonadaceae bacterium]